MRKLLVTLALAMVFFVGAFAAGFFAIGRAMAQPEAPDPNAGSAVDPHVGSPTSPDPHTQAPHHDPSEDFRFFGPPFGHGKKDVKGGPLGDGVMLDKDGNPILDHHGNPAEEEPMSAPFIFMVLNFVLLLIILVKFGGPPVNKAVTERHDQIKTALDEARKLRESAAEKLGELEAKLADADTEIERMIEGMRADAEADKARILDNAERQAAQMKRDAEQRIAAEIEYARAQLTREVTIAATKATEDLLKKKMVPGDQQKLVASFISDIQQGKEAR